MYAIIRMIYRLQIGPEVGIVVVCLINVVVGSFRFLLVVGRLVVVVEGGLLAFTETDIGLVFHRIAVSVLVVRCSPPILLDGLEEVSGSFAVNLVDLSLSAEIIAVIVLLVEPRVVVGRLVVVDVDVIVDSDVIVDVDGVVVTDFDVDVARLVVTGLIVVVT